MEAIPSGIVPIANLPGTGSLIARSYAIYAAHFQKIIQLTGLMVLGFLINISLSSFVGFLGQNAPIFGKFFLQLLSIGISGGIGLYYCYVFSALILMIAAWYRHAENISLQEACTRAGKIYKSLFLVGLLYGFVIAGTSFFILLPVIFSQGQYPVDTPSFRGLLMLYMTAFQWGTAVAIVLPLLFSVWYYFAIYAVILDGDRGIGALAKSRYLMHGMFFKVTGRYMTAAVLLILVFFLLYFTLALPYGWLIFVLLFIAYAFLVLPFFAVYEYLRYEDLHTVERTTEFAVIRGEHKSILAWSVIGAGVMVINILAGFFALLPIQAQKDFQTSLVKGSVYVLAPASIEINKNVEILASFFAKFRPQQQEERSNPGGLLPLAPDEESTYTAPKNYSDYNPPSGDSGNTVTY
ncbi:hypothetical protein HYW94_00705 [Candidatus Uhrbacteria bacterium]|nr:hypothetical protein [Candidatus Uhrbacteria bacterium]